MNDLISFLAKLLAGAPNPLARNVTVRCPEVLSVFVLISFIAYAVLLEGLKSNSPVGDLIYIYTEFDITKFGNA